MDERVSLEEAMGRLTERICPITETETVKLSEAIGRVCAVDVAADMDQPPFPRAPIDGYAVRAKDVEKVPVQLRVAGKICAGEVFDGALGEGECVRIMTGAPIPEGADAIVWQEDTDLGEEKVCIYEGVKSWENYCYAGEDYHQGEVLIHKGDRLGATEIAVLASMGRVEIEVLRKAKVAVLVTGDELTQPPQPLLPGKIYDSNLSYLRARLIELGNPALRTDHVVDDPKKMANEIIRCEKEGMDLLFTTGGVSVGEKDILHEVISILGGEILFRGLQMKPGYPTLAFRYQKVTVIALSGNPFGVVALFELLGRNALYRLTSNPIFAVKRQLASLKGEYKKGAGTRRFIRGNVVDGEVVISRGNPSAGALSSSIGCNSLVEIPERAAGAKDGDRLWTYLIG